MDEGQETHTDHNHGANGVSKDQCCSPQGGTTSGGTKGGNGKLSTTDSIGRVHQLRSEAKRLQRIALLAFGLVAGANSLYVYSSMARFLESGIREVGPALMPTVEYAARQQLPRVQDIAVKVAGSAVSQLEAIARRDGPALVDGLSAEGRKIELSMASKWPAVNKEVDSVVGKYQAAIGKNVERLIGRPLSVAEQQSIQKQLDTAVHQGTEQFAFGIFKAYEQDLRSIESHITRILDHEPDLIKQVSGGEAVGLMLELIGLEVQMNTIGR